MDSCAVLHLTSLAGGGVDRHVRDITRAVGRRHVIWHASEAMDVLELVAERRFFALDRARFESHPEIVSRWLRSLGVGIVHAHSMALAVRRRATWAMHALGLEAVATLHDILFLSPYAFDAPRAGNPDSDWIAATGEFLRRASAVVAPSEFLERLAERHIPGLEVAVVPNGSPPAHPMREVATHEDFATHKPAHVVAVLGAIGPHKGSDLLEVLPEFLEDTDIAIVIVGYLDRQLLPGWRAPGRLFVHGAYADEDAAALLHAYGAELVLFAHGVPESFSYALSDAWSAGLPALVAPDGALAERVQRHGGGWLLPANFSVEDVAATLRRLFSPAGAGEWARVKSEMAQSDPGRVPSLDAMTRPLEALYARYGIAADAPADPAALEGVLATHIDGSLFRLELVRLVTEIESMRAAHAVDRDRARRFEEESRQWIAKLEGDIESLKADLAKEVEARRALGQENVQLGIHKAAFDLLPGPVRKFLLKRILDARS